MLLHCLHIIQEGHRLMLWYNLVLIPDTKTASSDNAMHTRVMANRTCISRDKYVSDRTFGCQRQGNHGPHSERIRVGTSRSFIYIIPDQIRQRL